MAQPSCPGLSAELPASPAHSAPVQEEARFALGAALALAAASAPHQEAAVWAQPQVVLPVSAELPASVAPLASAAPFVPRAFPFSAVGADFPQAALPVSVLQAAPKKLAAPWGSRAHPLVFPED
jgi:hypothetical protein